MLFLIEQFHLDVYVPPDLPRGEARAITRTLNGRAFRTRLRSSIKAVVQRYPTLKKSTIRVSC
ncbi:MAG: hypothetical protein AB7K24_16285 [Gemmataceae bacterium]